ncbi:Enzymatic polyprotein [Glycine max]|nr:Enzymatic polyprotein [Glycine max]
MVAMAYQTSHECSEETIIDILTDLNGKVITNDDDKEIPDAVNTLIFTIAQHFIGDPSLWKDRSAELLSNLKCRTLADFRWYRDTFLTRVYTREDSQQPFWKEKFLAGLPRSLGDKVRDKIRSQSANGDIPYESLSYGQLISYVQKVALKICQDDKIQRQLANEKAQTKRDLGSFCEQFGLPACPKQKKKQSSKKEIHENKPKRFPRRRYSHKPSTSRGMENPKQKTKSKITCYNCGKQGHISKYCRLKKKLRNLNLEPAIEEQINNLLIETSEEETETSSSVLSDENLNLIQQDDQLSSTDDDDGQINTLTREQDLLFEAINSIPDPQEKKVFLEKLKKTLEVKPRQKDFITNNKFDVSNILKRLENSSTKPTTIQDLQTEINNLKREVKELRQQQEIHQIILSQLEEDSDSESTNNSEENQPENLEDDMFMGLINKIKIQKFYINIKIIINDFVLETMALFDTGADSNCILEGLIPTKFLEKTSEKLSTANGSKLKINFKLSNAIIENQGLKINTNFLLVKNLKNEVILGTPFIRALFPIQISNEGITTNHLGRKIIFNFSTKPISRNINLIENKINQINFLKEEVSFNNIQIQLGKPQVKERIQSLLNHIESTVCSELPHAFWDRKKHIAFKIVETDASDIGYGGILKQRVHGQDHVIAYTSKHWNPAQLKYSTVKKEVLAIVLCISKFQSDLLNQKFLIRVDCKSAKDILQKDVKNLASKQIFARWQAILSNTSRAPQIHYLTTLPVNSYRKVVMPPKASGISLRGGRSTGKGARLALPEPTIKKSSTTSGSPTQAGSSTQKTNLEGSSTQIASIKPEPSTQESPKPATAKQTSADYAWPIETLQALQDMGLTKFPKIIKKSWADIASESDDESESNLQTMIQNASMTKTATNTKGKLPLAKAQTPPTKQTNNYIYKNKLLTVLQMEPEFWDKNPFKATAKAFPPGFHYKPTTILKTRTFYELILVDSNSVSIKHFKDPKDQTLNTHSTIQILKVLQPRHFGSDLNKGKRFSVPFDPVGYTYWDYVDAWTKVFWHQNTRFKHSWLIYFKTNTIYNFPNWFLQWWDFFGPIPEIFPETVQQGFSQFKKQYNSQESRIPADLKYFSSFALSWIFSWQYRYSKTEKTNQYPSLQRHAFVKWWTQFDSSKADPEQVKLWFQSHPEVLKAADPETSVFLNQKSHLAAFLAGSTSKEVLAKNLKEVLQMLQQEEEASSSKKEETSSAEEDEEDPFYQNEDDCFGICLD